MRSANLVSAIVATGPMPFVSACAASAPRWTSGTDASGFEGRQHDPTPVARPNRTGENSSTIEYSLWPTDDDR